MTLQETSSNSTGNDSEEVMIRYQEINEGTTTFVVILIRGLIFIADALFIISCVYSTSIEMPLVVFIALINILVFWGTAWMARVETKREASYARFTLEGVYIYDGSDTVMIRKEVINDPGKCKIDATYHIITLKFIGGKSYCIQGSVTDVSSALNYMEKYYGVNLIKR